MKHSGNYQRFLNDSTDFQKFLKTIGMGKKILDFSGNFHNNTFFISRLLVILLENLYNQINTLFTIIYLPSISGSAET